MLTARPAQRFSTLGPSQCSLRTCGYVERSITFHTPAPNAACSASPFLGMASVTEAWGKVKGETASGGLSFSYQPSLSFRRVERTSSALLVSRSCGLSAMAECGPPIRHDARASRNAPVANLDAPRSSDHAEHLIVQLLREAAR
jgi:hypothetical protein